MPGPFAGPLAPGWRLPAPQRAAPSKLYALHVPSRLDRAGHGHEKHACGAKVRVTVTNGDRRDAGALPCRARLARHEVGGATGVLIAAPAVGAASPSPRRALRRAARIADMKLAGQLACNHLAARWILRSTPGCAAVTIGA